MRGGAEGKDNTKILKNHQGEGGATSNATLPRKRETAEKKDPSREGYNQKRKRL